MKRGLFIPLLMFSVLSCQQTNEIQEAETTGIETDISYFDYLANLEFGSTRQDLARMLPTDLKMQMDNEDGVAYQNTKNGVTQELSFVFYGEKVFSEAIISIQFSREDSNCSRVFQRLLNSFECKYGQASEVIYEGGYEVHEWEMKNKGLIQNLIVESDNEILNINFSVRLPESSNNYNIEDGEWVPTGPDGRMVFVPKN